MLFSSYQLVCQYLVCRLTRSLILAGLHLFYQWYWCWLWDWPVRDLSTLYEIICDATRPSVLGEQASNEFPEEFRTIFLLDYSLNSYEEFFVYVLVHEKEPGRAWLLTPVVFGNRDRVFSVQTDCLFIRKIEFGLSVLQAWLIGVIFGIDWDNELKYELARLFSKRLAVLNSRVRRFRNGLANVG